MKVLLLTLIGIQADIQNWPWPEFECPGLKLVKRDDWNAEPPKYEYDYVDYGIKNVFVHHTYGGQVKK